MFRVFVIALFFLLSMPVQAQVLQADSGAVVATFGEARAMDVDASGRIYVSLAREGTIRLFPAVDERAALGGPGIRQGQLDEPSDVVVPEGPVIYVADAGNGRIQRFTREGLPLGSLMAGEAFDEGLARGGHSGRSAGERRSGTASARPVSVDVGAAGEVFAVDTDRRAVLKWNARLQPERIIGGFDAGAGVLQMPVSVAVDRSQGHLYVADERAGAVLKYDNGGTYMGLIGKDLHGIQNIRIHSGKLLVVLKNRILEFGIGGLQLTRTINTKETVIDAIPRSDETWLLLTPTKLIVLKEKGSSVNQ